MARKIKFALEMADGAKVRGSLEELREHFDLETVVGYFLSGKLLEWLEDRYYEDELEALEKIDKDSPNFRQQLCRTLGVEFADEGETNVEALNRLNEKKAILRQKTDDEKIIKNAAKTAFTQEDLADLLDKGESVIYLCGESFHVPLLFNLKRYVGILGTPRITLKADSQRDVDAKGVVFENVKLPWDEEPAQSSTAMNENPDNKIAHAVNHSTQTGMEKTIHKALSSELRDRAKQLLKEINHCKQEIWKDRGILVLLYPGPGTKEHIHNEIVNCAADFKHQMSNSLPLEVDERIEQLEYFQYHYEEIQKEGGIGYLPTNPSLQNVIGALQRQLNSVKNWRPQQSLESVLSSAAAYQKSSGDSFFSVTEYYIYNEDELQEIAVDYYRRYLHKIEKSEAGYLVNAYLISMKDNLSTIIKNMHKRVIERLGGKEKWQEKSNLHWKWQTEQR